MNRGFIFRSIPFSNIRDLNIASSYTSSVRFQIGYDSFIELLRLVKGPVVTENARKICLRSIKPF